MKRFVLSLVAGGLALGGLAMTPGTAKADPYVHRPVYHARYRYRALRHPPRYPGYYWYRYYWYRY